MNALVTRALLVAALALLVSACSTVRFSYNNATLPLRFLAWEYFDLDTAQFDELKTRLAGFQDWHRAEELGGYAALVHEAGERIAKGVAIEDTAWAIAAIHERYRVLVARAVRDAVPILVTLAPEQLQVLEKKLEENRSKYAKEFVQVDEDKHVRRRTKRMVEYFEDWTGDLSDAQEAMIERFARSHVRMPALALEDRRRWHRDALALLRQHRDAVDLEARLIDLFVHPDRYRSPRYVQERRRWEDELGRLVVEMGRTLTSEQRSHALRRMERYAEDLRSLYAERRVTRVSAP